MYQLIGADGRCYGPVSAEQVRLWIGENRANAQTLVLPEGAPEWKPLGTRAEFADALKPVPPIFGMSAGPHAANKIAAGVFGILLGSLGIHKFILGYTRAGLILLLVSVVSCGVLTPITGLIGLIEGIIYLAKTDEDFAQTYVEHRKEWF